MGDTATVLGEYIVFASDGVAVLDSVVVDEDLQGNGVGTAITEDIINEVSSRADTIYILPLNDTSEHLAQKHSFEPAETERLEKWYVRSV